MRRRAHDERPLEIRLHNHPFAALMRTPLAIELAEAIGVTLIGVVRAEGFNINAHPERVEA